MLIKEYRIPMPMSVEEYRIAQLYMIQKKSREESCGEGSGVEILENKPYTDGPGGTGQYTHKVYHIGMHIPSWFRSILPKAALRVEEESWNAYPYTRTRYTCPFVEKFSIDIETYYKPDTGNQADVFNMSAVERRQRSIDPIDIVTDPIPPHEYKAEEDTRLYHSAKTQRGPLLDDWIEEYNNNPGMSPIMCAYKLCKVEFRYWGMQSKIERFIHDVGLRKVMARAHRQAWCWQDEWYGLTMEDIRQLELETQLALATKMAQFSQAEEAAEANGGAPSPDKEQEAKEAISSIEAEEVVVSSGGETLQPRGVLTKQWSTSSRSSRSSKRGVSPSRHSISEWRMQSIARDSEDSSDEEFFDAYEDLSDNEDALPKEITKWNSNDLMDKIDAADSEETPGELFKEMTVDYERATSEERLDEESSSAQCLQPSKIHVLILVLHGGNILDTGGGDQNSKQADVNTISTAFEAVMRLHYPAALGRIAIRLVPCPAICAEAFSLVSNLSPYSYDEGCLSSSQDHIPLAALPLLATSAPQYQDAMATVIVRANQVYSDFLKSLEGAAFSGQVCLIGDCVGGILGFDALCSSNQTVNESQNSSRRGSLVSVQDQDLLSPGIIVNSVQGSASPTLESSRHLSRSNIDIPRSGSGDDAKRQLPRKRSDSSTYELDTIKQHHAFLTSLHSSVLRSDAVSRRSSSSTMLDGSSLGRFDFEVSDFFLFGSPLGLVLALRKTVIPMLDVAQLRPACQQVYNLFHPADPSASRLEPLLERKFHLLPPFNVPRYQRFPLGDGNSALLVETVQSNAQLLLDSGPPLLSLRCQETISETCIPVPMLNWQEGCLKATPATMESDVVQSHGGVFMDSSYPSSPVTGPLSRGQRRASEVSMASQVSGMADSYTATNIANTKSCQINQSKIIGLLSQLALSSQNKLFLRSPPNSRKKVESGDAAGSPDADLASEQDSEADSSESINPTGKYENCLSPGLDFAISDLVSLDSQAEVDQVAARWWGTKRLDFALYCPDALTAFPTVALPHLFHASYWESTDVVSFLLRQVMRHENSSILELDGKEVTEFTPSKPREKWLRKRTHVKIRNVTANHRAVDLHQNPPPSGRWIYFDQRTNSSGRVLFVVPDDKPTCARSVLLCYRHPLNTTLFGRCLGVEWRFLGTKTFITEGYAAHLSQLEYSHRSRPAKSSTARMVLRKGSFGLGANSDFLRKRKHLLRTISSQPAPSSPTGSVHSRPERTQSQSDGERLESAHSYGPGGAQRSMSITANCWGRSSSTKMEPAILSPK
ncbi:membrane-associated phosphatidylinositol transfer protein 2 [Notothenia coriiceps]|uniref:Membrane-associated phosphatidylinositol transfer protein 2 n=1 Tax=Notothenia coriiceps TaxID=8208 RepID=A0A6I9PLK7_9TELE|nr:PREDICTED: membrane-associated phosphatidylinositol transfer protein 2 [Notothenia coriiceps]